MVSAVILLADGTEEIEFITPYDVLTRAGFQVKSVGVDLKTSNYATCSRNARIVPDVPSAKSIASDSPVDILVLPGGGPGAKTFCGSSEVLQLIRKYRQADKYVAFICAGTTALVASVNDAGSGNLGMKCKVTSHPSVKDEIVKAGWDYADESERVVVDGKVITSRGPGTAMLFSLTIVECVLGREKRDEIAGPMVCAEGLMKTVESVKK
ncbi:DJ-1 [Aulographum hederae CBS 113979]|uniref:D-lactate dehydratase n=1 Tax=Aulographum hederae CBS 113979 TaxID=1176131 RepID=A0A6G1HEQ5_9PEZI|nr:DJ-1 [Aulographum hederae CBS 113979]